MNVGDIVILANFLSVSLSRMNSRYAVSGEGWFHTIKIVSISGAGKVNWIPIKDRLITLEAGDTCVWFVVLDPVFGVWMI